MRRKMNNTAAWSVQLTFPTTASSGHSGWKFLARRNNSYMYIYNSIRTPSLIIYTICTGKKTELTTHQATVLPLVTADKTLRVMCTTFVISLQRQTQTKAHAHIQTK